MSAGVRRLDMHVDLAMALDPCAIFEAVVGQPDDWQRQLLESDSKRVLLCCSRQSGKSSVSAAIALRQAMFFPGSLILLVSPSLRQSSELFRKVAEYFHKLGGEAPEQESTLRLELKNGSRIIALPGSEATVRGYSGADLIVLDEAARIPDELLAALRPSIATKSDSARLIYLSTPWGRRGFFWDAWQNGAGWEKFEVPAGECPRITPEFLEQERHALGELVFRSEYLCEFLDPESQVIPSELIEAALSDEQPFDF